MPNLTATIPHQFTRAEARRRIEEHASMLRNQQGGVVSDVQTHWVQDTMHFTVKAVGQSLTGQIMIDDQAVHLTVVLPWLMSLMSGRIKQELEQGVRKALNAPVQQLPKT